MRYPRDLEKGDVIGICAPSKGITKPEDLKKLERAILQFKKMGYQVLETKSVRCNRQGRSARASVRAKEFMELYKNEKVGLILYAGGGNFLMEMLDELDFEALSKLEPKWTQGFSDITHLSILLNTLCDVPSLYCENIKDYGMKELFRNLTDSLAIASGEDIMQTSFALYQEESEDNPDGTYHLTKKVEWKNLTKEEKILIQGRAIGGCLDCIDTLIGTKFDRICEYGETYQKDGLLWFLECYEMNTPQLQRILWKMKHAGYFQYANGIVFGRSYIMRQDYEVTEEQAILDALGELNIPIITGADIGHKPPQLAMVNGALLTIQSEKGRGMVSIKRT